MKIRLIYVLTLALSLWTASASAANVTASMLVTQAGGLSWDEDLSGLMTQLQDGTNYGNPDMYYAVSAINNSSLTQTYTFTIGSAITPTVSGANTVYTEFSGSLTGRRGVSKSIDAVFSSGIQRVELSADNGLTFVNAGVDLGQGTTSTGASSIFGLYSAINSNGPTGQTWNYMRLVSTFTLTGNSAVALTGYASVTPVPEVDEAAMLLMGLAMLASVARYRRTKLDT
ncbi:hypothetical protein [Rhodoferax sp. GW822-FHT02A01]|uniref:hypothetical protein n=1 Tax=Rhodoferax sp. GW822-FHT02A01 TaxID=3141537 RepID=UPI00315D4475